MEIYLTKYKKTFTGIEASSYLNLDDKALHIRQIRYLNQRGATTKSSINSFPIFEAYGYFEAIQRKNLYAHNIKSLNDYSKKIDEKPQLDSPDLADELDFHELAVNNKVQYKVKGNESIFKQALDEKTQRVQEPPDQFFGLMDPSLYSFVQTFTVPDIITYMNLYYEFNEILIAQCYSLTSFRVDFGRKGRAKRHGVSVAANPGATITVLYTFQGISYKVEVYDPFGSPDKIAHYIDYNILIEVTAEFIMQQMFMSSVVTCESTEMCPICLESESREGDRTIKLQRCGHEFCESCWISWSKVRRVCPLCNAKLWPSGLYPKYMTGQHLLFNKYWKLRILSENPYFFHLLDSYDESSAFSLSENTLTSFIDHVITKAQLFIPSPFNLNNEQLNMDLEYIKPQPTWLQRLQNTTSINYMVNNFKKDQTNRLAIFFIGDYLLRASISLYNFNESDLLAPSQTNFFYPTNEFTGTFNQQLDREMNGSKGSIMKMLIGASTLLPHNDPKRKLQVLYNRWVNVFRGQKDLSRISLMVETRLLMSIPVIFRFDNEKFRVLSKQYLHRYEALKKEWNKPTFKVPPANKKFLRGLEMDAISKRNLTNSHKAPTLELLLIDLILSISNIAEITFILTDYGKKRWKEFVASLDLPSKAIKAFDIIDSLSFLNDMEYAYQSLYAIQASKNQQLQLNVQAVVLTIAFFVCIISTIASCLVSVKPPAIDQS